MRHTQLQAAALQLKSAQTALKQAQAELIAIHPLAQETKPFRAIAAMSFQLSEVIGEVLRLKV